MLETESRLKSDKTIFVKLREDNQAMNKVIEKHLKLLHGAEEADALNTGLKTMSKQSAEME